VTVGVRDEMCHWGGPGSLSRTSEIADQSHQELTEAIVELVDVSEHPHGQILRQLAERVHSVRGSVHTCMECPQLKDRAL
jgi:hypothetical protein